MSRNSSDHKDRVRVTVSLSKELVARLDETVDGIKIRNRSHAVESILSEKIDEGGIYQAVIMAGGEEALERLPAIQETLREMGGQGISKVIIAVGYLGGKIAESIGDGASYGLQISYRESELGTGGALRALQSEFTSTFLVVNVIDVAIKVPLKQLYQFHYHHQATVTIASRGIQDLTGIYVIEPLIFKFIPEGFCMLEDTVFNEVSKQGKLLFYPVKS